MTKKAAKPNSGPNSCPTQIDAVALNGLGKQIVENHRQNLESWRHELSQRKPTEVRRDVRNLLRESAAFSFFTEKEVFNAIYGSEDGRLYWLGWLEENTIRLDEIAEVLAIHRYIDLSDEGEAPWSMPSKLGELMQTESYQSMLNNLHRIKQKAISEKQGETSADIYGPVELASRRVNEMMTLKVDKFLVPLVRLLDEGGFGQPFKNSLVPDNPAATRFHFSDAACWFNAGEERRVHLPKSLRVILDSSEGTRFRAMFEQRAAGSAPYISEPLKRTPDNNKKSFKKNTDKAKSSDGDGLDDSLPEVAPSSAATVMARRRSIKKQNSYEMAVNKIITDIQDLRAKGEYWHQKDHVEQYIKYNLSEGLSPVSLLEKLKKALKAADIPLNYSRGKARRTTGT